MSCSRAAEYCEYARHCIRFAHLSTPHLRRQLVESAAEWARKSVAAEKQSQTEKTEFAPLATADDLYTWMKRAAVLRNPAIAAGISECSAIQAWRGRSQWSLATLDL